MAWNHEISYFFGGLFLANAIPHYVSSVMGRPFQSPFAKPSGEGLSSSRINVLWGSFNFVAAYVLLCRVGQFHLRSTADVTAFALGAFVISYFAASHFGKFHGGNSPGAA